MVPVRDKEEEANKREFWEEVGRELRRTQKRGRSDTPSYVSTGASVRLVPELKVFLGVLSLCLSPRTGCHITCLSGWPALSALLWQRVSPVCVCVCVGGDTRTLRHALVFCPVFYVLRKDW